MLFAVLGALLALVVIGAVSMSVRANANQQVVSAKKTELGSFTAATVAQHNSRNDLWIILKLDGKARVYDLTSYVDEHPGGDAILTNAGGDSTDAFLGPQHPPRVRDLIEDFVIGDLVE